MNRKFWFREMMENDATSKQGLDKYFDLKKQELQDFAKKVHIARQTCQQLLIDFPLGDTLKQTIENTRELGQGQIEEIRDSRMWVDAEDLYSQPSDRVNGAVVTGYTEGPGGHSIGYSYFTNPKAAVLAMIQHSLCGQLWQEKNDWQETLVTDEDILEWEWTLTWVKFLLDSDSLTIEEVGKICLPDETLSLECQSLLSFLQLDDDEISAYFDVGDPFNIDLENEAEWQWLSRRLPASDQGF